MRSPTVAIRSRERIAPSGCPEETLRSDPAPERSRARAPATARGELRLNGQPPNLDPAGRKRLIRRARLLATTVPANGGRPRSAFGGSGAEARTEQRHHVVGLRVATDHRLRENQIVADMDVEDAARSRHQFDGADARLKLFEDSRCQTDSVWQRASRDAVLDANDGSTGHEPMLSPDREYGRP